MRIVLVVPGFPKLSETFIVSKFLGLLDRGYDVHIVCSSSEDGEWAQFEQLQGRSDVRDRVHVNWPVRPRWLVILLFPLVLLFTLWRQPRATSRYLTAGWRRFGWDAVRRFYLDARIIQLQPDVVHFEFGALAIGRLHLRELLEAWVTVSFRGHDLSFVGIDIPGYYDEVWQQADKLHLLGQDLWQRAQERGCSRNKPHKFIPPAIDTAIFDAGKRGQTYERSQNDQAVRILSVGRLTWAKGYEYALQAIEQVREQGIEVEYKVVGDGEYFEALAFCRHQLGLDDCVTFMGKLPPAEIPRQMQWADVFLHASVSEGFCNAVIEAQAMELPVVTTNAGGLAGNVEDGVTGFVVSRRDPQALAEKIILLAQNHELRRTMGQAGRHRVQRYFQIEDQIDAFASFYDSLLESAWEA